MFEKDISVVMLKSCSAQHNSLAVRMTENGAWLAFPHADEISVAKLEKNKTVLTKLAAKQPPPIKNIVQLQWCQIGNICYLVACTSRSVDFYSAESNVLLFSHDSFSLEGSTPVFTRGIAAYNGTICVGSADGNLLCFSSDSGAEGDIFLQQKTRVSSSAICAVAADTKLVSASDQQGTIVLCATIDDAIQIMRKIDGFGSSCTSIALICGVLVAAYGSGHLRVFDASSGTIRAECTAHCRWITALDAVCDGDGALVTTAAEDARVKVWRVSGAASVDDKLLVHKFTTEVTDARLMGVRFIRHRGASFAAAAYDRKQIYIYTM